MNRFLIVLFFVSAIAQAQGQISVPLMLSAKKYLITPTSGSNGTISPSVVTKVRKGKSQTFTITPTSSYVLDSLVVDGVKNTDSTTSYTFKNTAANHTIAVTFKWELRFQTIATTSTFDPSFVKTGTQSIEMAMSDTTYSGLSFSVIPANRGLTGTKVVNFHSPQPSTITTIDVNSDSLTGSIPSLTANTALVNFWCYTNLLTGSIPSLSTNTALATFYSFNSRLTGYTASTIALTVTMFRADNNLIADTTNINQILSDFATNIASRPTSATLNIGGTGNSAPGTLGAVNKGLIQARGWTVTTN
jgi:hypothetical protein